MRSISDAILAAALTLAASSSLAQATTITFDHSVAAVPGDPFSNLQNHNSLYSEAGYGFANNGGIQALFSWANGSSFDADASATSATLAVDYPQTTTTLTRDGGGAFNLDSIDIADVYNNGSFSGVLNYAYSLFGGGGGNGSFSVDALVGLQTASLGLSNLLSFSFTPTEDLRWVQIDNVQVSAVPIPAALPLFAVGLGAFAGSRGRKARR